MKCCKAAHVILDFGVNRLATYTTRAVLGRIFPVFYGRVGKMGGLRISSNRRRVKDEDDYIDVDYRLAPYIMERVLIIKNRSCQFSFDCGVLADMYAERNKFAYR